MSKRQVKNPMEKKRTKSKFYLSIMRSYIQFKAYKIFFEKIFVCLGVHKLTSETQGFEPWVHIATYDGLANRSFRPLRHVSIGGEGRIRTHGGITTTVFKTAALNHSATSPFLYNLCEKGWVSIEFA
jgi:hypothetical protein